MKILVTGHKGFIGSHVYDYFKNEISNAFHKYPVYTYWVE